MFSRAMNEAPITTKRRPVLAMSGWLLFVCLFLPTLKVCGSPTAPISFPPVYGIYVGAALIALIAGSRTLRTRRVLSYVVVALTYLSVTLYGWAFVMDVSPVVAACLAVVVLALGVVLVRALVRARPNPSHPLIACVVHATLTTLWCGLLALDGDAMWGAYVGIAASGVMLLSAVVALADERNRGAAEALPVARVL
jgi:hypothetical protein